MFNLSNCASSLKNAFKVLTTCGNTRAKLIAAVEYPTVSLTYGINKDPPIATARNTLLGILDSKLSESKISILFQALPSVVNTSDNVTNCLFKLSSLYTFSA